jgi:AsmA protein
MTGKADRRRPLVVAIVLIASITAALVAPVLIGARRGEPIPGTIVRADSRDAVTISHPLALFSSPAVVLEKGTVALVGPNESGVGALLRTLVLGGGADLVLDGAKLVVDRRKAPAAPAIVPAAEELKPVVATLSDFKFRSLAILDSTIVVETDSGKEQELTLTNVEIAPAGGGVISAKGEVVYRGERLNIDLVFERSDGKAPDAPLAVRALVKSDLLNATLNGHLTLADHGQVIAENAELSVSDLRRFANWLGTSWPHGPGLGMLTAKGLLTLEEKVVSFDRAEFTLDGNAAMGTMMLKFAGERPSIEGTLAFQSFDLAPYVASARPSAFSLASNWLSAIEIPGLGSRSFLTQMDADIRLSANNVVNGSVRLGRTAASLSVKNGKLFGDVAELEFDQGGRGEAQFTADATGPEPLYTLRADLSDIDFETAAPYLSTYLIDGSGDVRMDLTASGVSETDIARSLAGKISLDLSEGARLGVNLSALHHAVATPAPVEGWGEVGTGVTTFTKLTANLTAFRGVIKTETFEAETGDSSVAAAGSVDLENKTMDVIVSVGPPGAAPAIGAEADGGHAYKITGRCSAPLITKAAPSKAAVASPPPTADPG